jgi:hypothetical protein
MILIPYGKYYKNYKPRVSENVDDTVQVRGGQGICLAEWRSGKKKDGGKGIKRYWHVKDKFNRANQ